MKTTSIFLLSCCLTFALSGLLHGEEEKSLYDMSFEELGKLQFTTSATLTPTEENKIPAAVTIIDHDMIRRSGARSLGQLLEVYVPNLQIMRHNWVGTNVGTRGLLFDLNDKMLLLVNGRVMNNRTFYGADSEFMLSMLGDIHHIEVIRGPGSATFGPGAISCVVNIHTFDSSNFSGSDVILKQGFIEEFSSLELRLGKKFSNSSGLFFYFGGDFYQGSDQKYSPQYYSIPVLGHPANSTIPFDIGDDQQAFRGRPRLKSHLHYQLDSFDLWLRYTDGGKREFGARELIGFDEYIDVGYRQFTIMADYKEQLSDTLEMKLSLSFDMYNRVRAYTKRTPSRETQLNIREDEYFAKLLFNWEPHKQHKIAFGLDYSYELFGRRPYGWPHETQTHRPDSSPWETHSFGLFAEDQWAINDSWTSFLALRIDKHSYSEFMLSPRAALVYTPTAKDTLKLIYNRSVRKTSDFFLRLEHINTREESDEVETLDSWELRYERQHTDALSSSISTFYTVLDTISFQSAQLSIAKTGELSLYGIEFELAYETKENKVIFSHGFTQMKDFKLMDPTITAQVISAHPYGYGEHLEHWSSNITKLYFEQKLSDKWLANASLVYYWDFDGASDFAEYNYQNGVNANWSESDGSNKAFADSIYLNAGIEYKPTENLTFNLTAHNILGWIDKDHNKRNYFYQTGTYRNEAAAVSFQMNYEF